MTDKFRLLIEYVIGIERVFYFNTYKEAWRFLESEHKKKTSYGGSIVKDWDINGY